MKSKLFDNVQSIGHGTIKNFGVRAPWGVVPLAGGPYRHKPDEPNYFGIKGAVEIDRPYSVKIDIIDFGIPVDDGEVELAIVSALARIRSTASINASISTSVPTVIRKYRHTRGSLKYRTRMPCSMSASFMAAASVGG